MAPYAAVTRESNLGENMADAHSSFVKVRPSICSTSAI